jgi:hypothetical protein
LASDIGASVQAALDKLYDRDGDLLRNDVNERTITHKLAEYLEAEFPEWHVDCEYNRNHDRTKRLKSLQRRTISIDNTDGISVFPDIILHRRTTDKNLLVIEVKKSTSSESPDFDIEKLSAFKEELGYRHALFLLLKTGNKQTGAELKWV